MRRQGEDKQIQDTLTDQELSPWGKNKKKKLKNNLKKALLNVASVIRLKKNSLNTQQICTKMN